MDFALIILAVAVVAAALILAFARPARTAVEPAAPPAPDSRLDTLLARFEAAVTRDNIAFSLKIDAADGAALAFAYRHAQVLDRRERGGKISLSLRVHPDSLARFEARFPKKIVVK